MKDPKPSESTLKIEEDHKQIRKLLTSMEVSVETLDSSKIDIKSWRGTMSDNLSSLGERLGPHFELEELTDLFTKLPEDFPRFAIALENLKDEHPEILSLVETTHTSVQNAETLDALKKAAEEVRTLVRALRKHESGETEILQKAYGDDLGGMD